MSMRLIAVILLCGGLYLLGNGRVQLWDRDEPRYAQASRQMLQSGDWVMPKLLDEPRINKPPLIYWCQAAAMRVFGDNGMAARLPSAVATFVILIVLAGVLVRWVGEERAFWGVTIFGTSGLVVMAAKMCLTDAVLLLFVTVSQLCLYAMWRGRGTWGVVVAFAVATGLGLLTKGPVVLGVNGMTLGVLGVLWWVDRKRGKASLRSRRESLDAPGPALTLPSPGVPGEGKSGSGGVSPTRSWRAVVAKILAALMIVLPKVLVALVIVLAIGGPWVVAMQKRLPGGLEATFKHDVIKRMTQPLEQHKGPPGYYLLFFLVSFFPWCLLLPTAVKVAWRHRADPLIRFSLAAVVGPWVMFELIQTKLPHYVLPCFPFLAILTADTLVRCARGEYPDWLERRWRVAVGVWAVIVVLVGLGPWVAYVPGLKFEGLPLLATVAVSVGAAGCAVAVYALFARGRVWGAGYAMAGTMFVMFGLLFGWYLPNAPYLHLSTRVGTYLKEVGATEKGEVYMIDYKEDTLPFYQGGTIRPQPKNAYLAQVGPEEWPEFMVITREIWEAAPAAARERLEVLKTFRGWAYAAKGRVRDVMVVRKRG